VPPSWILSPPPIRLNNSLNKYSLVISLRFSFFARALATFAYYIYNYYVICWALIQLRPAVGAYVRVFDELYPAVRAVNIFRRKRSSTIHTGTESHRNKFPAATTQNTRFLLPSNFAKTHTPMQTLTKTNQTQHPLTQHNNLV